MELFAEQRLKPGFQAALDAGYYREAHRLASDYSKCITSADGLQLLRDLTVHSNTPPNVGANALMELAGRATGSGGDLSRSDLLQRAKALYKDSAHAHGVEDVELSEACDQLSELKRGEGVMESVSFDFDRIFEKYDQLDYMAGQEEGLNKFIDAIDSPGTFQQQVDLLQKSQDISKRTGKKLIWCMRQLSLIGRWLKTSSNFAKILESVQSLWNELVPMDCHFLAGSTAQFAVEVYCILRDGRRATLWAERVKEKWAYCLPLDQAEASTILMRARLIGIKAADVSVLGDILTWGHDEVESDIRNQFFESAVDKTEMLLLKQMEIGNGRVPQPNPHIDLLVSKIEALVSKIVGPQAISKVINLEQTRMNLLCQEAQGDRNSPAIEEQALLLEEKIVKLCLENKKLFEAASTRMMGALLHFSIFQKTAKQSALQSCYERFEVARDAFEALGIIGHMKTATYWVSLCLYEGWAKGWVGLDKALAMLADAEKLAAQEKSELSILAKFDAVEVKRRVGAEKHVRDVYRFAIQICIAGSLDMLLWEWVQRAKARSLSDIMGLGTLIPKRLQEQIKHDKVLSGMLDDELDLMQQLRDGEGSEKLRLRHELEALHAKMGEHAELRELLSLRSGRPINFQEAQDIICGFATNPNPANLVFVDWFCCNDEIYLTILTGSGPPKCYRTGRLMNEVGLWKRKYLDTDTGIKECLQTENSEESVLRQLDFLIKPLEENCDPEDILVLSPTAALHAIPLHALWISPHEELIDRNPVIYCASITTFTQCLQNKDGGQNMENLYQQTLIAVYEQNADTDFNAEEQTAIYESANHLATKYNMEKVLGRDADQKSLVNAMQRSGWIHYHGHCLSSGAEIVDQSLLLADGKVFVKDFFSISIPSSHITLVACESASQNFVDGDEPLGIVTALLCAGAASVTGTLWALPSAIGRLFTDLLYEEIRSVPSMDAVNLAQALRAVVLEIKGDWRTRQPYYWASFVHHGSFLSRSRTCNGNG